MIRLDPVFAWGRSLHIGKWRSWLPPWYTSSGSNRQMSPRMLHTKQCLPSTWIKASICMPTHVQFDLLNKQLYHLLLLQKMYYIFHNYTLCWVKECWIILYSNCHLKECNRTKHGNSFPKPKPLIRQSVYFLNRIIPIGKNKKMIRIECKQKQKHGTQIEMFVSESLTGEYRLQNLYSKLLWCKQSKFANDTIKR